MYLSLLYLGIDNTPAIIVSFIPLVLGMLNVMAGTAYAIAALVFILAAFSALIPAKYDNAVDFVTKITSDVGLNRGASRTTPQDKNDETKKRTDKDNAPNQSK